jgi:hypothetical protein
MMARDYFHEDLSATNQRRVADDSAEAREQDLEEAGRVINLGVANSAIGSTYA